MSDSSLQTNNSKKHKTISLFSGIAGLDVGVSRPDKLKCDLLNCLEGVVNLLVGPGGATRLAMLLARYRHVLPGWEITLCIF